VIHFVVALFESIESNQVDKLKALLEKEESHINDLTSDGLSLLDVAVLLDSSSITKVLLQNGARSGLEANDSIDNHLNALLLDAEQKLYQVQAPSSSGVVLDSDKQKSLYDKRVKLLRKMMIGWQNLRTPDSPFSFSIGESPPAGLIIRRDYREISFRLVSFQM
jgi:hypothetical protein